MATKKILIAEDERAMSKALELKLTHAGFEVKPVFNGEEALEVISKEKFDLILMDLMMPKTDGFSVLETLQKKGNKIPIIVTSNLGQEEDFKRATALGANDYLIKSNTPIAKIVDRIREFLEGKK